MTATSLREGWADFWKLYDAGRWEPDTRALIHDTLNAGDLYVDIGAWIGPTVAWALETGAHVIAIEPDPAAVTELRRLACDRLEIVEAAVVTHPGPVRLAPNPVPGGEYGDSMSRLAHDGITVPGITLPKILNGREPDLVKIDVEGYETELCPVLLPWLASFGCTVQVSLHGTRLDLASLAGFANVEDNGDTWADLVLRP